MFRGKATIIDNYHDNHGHKYDDLADYDNDHGTSPLHHYHNGRYHDHLFAYINYDNSPYTYHYGPARPNNDYDPAYDDIDDRSSATDVD